MAKVLVTGADSFIGRHLISRLISDRAEVSALIRTPKNIPAEWDETVKIYNGDITIKESIAGVCRNIEMVFHLAAKVHDFSEADSAHEHFAVNVEGTRNLLDECKGSGIRHFIYFSSVKAMTEESSSPLNETFESAPATPYGKSKLAAERLVTEYGRKYGFKTTSLRLPLVYGPGNKGNIYRMITAVDRYRFIMIGPGLNRRSMVYVGNVVDAAVSVADRKEADGKVFIITDAIDYAIRELYAVIAKSLGKKMLPFHLPMWIAKWVALLGDAAGSIIRSSLLFNSGMLRKLTSPLIFSSHGIQEEIGFKPKYNLYNTIDETIRWYENSKNNS